MTEGLGEDKPRIGVVGRSGGPVPSVARRPPIADDCSLESRYQSELLCLAQSPRSRSPLRG